MRTASYVVVALVAVMISLGAASHASAAPSSSSPARTSTIDAATIDAYLMTKASPMVGQGAAFIASGGAWKVDPRLLVAIAGAESSFGQITCAPFNAWGYGCPNGPYRFSSWADGIDTVAKGLRTNYLAEGRTSVALINLKYAPIGAANDPTGLNNNWTINVSRFLTELGGDPANIDIAGVGGVLAVGPDVDTSADGVSFTVDNDAAPGRITLVAGSPRALVFALTNTGTTPWQAGDVRLRRIDAESRIASAPIAALQEATVAPQATGHFRVAISAQGSHATRITTSWRIEGAAGPAGEQIDRAIDLDVPQFVVGEMTSTLSRGADGVTTVVVRAQNQGSAAWQREHAALGIVDVSPGIAPVGWLSTRIPARMLERRVEPGAWASFAFRVRVSRADAAVRVGVYVDDAWAAGDALLVTLG